MNPNDISIRPNWKTRTKQFFQQPVSCKLWELIIMCVVAGIGAGAFMSFMEWMK